MYNGDNGNTSLMGVLVDLPSIYWPLCIVSADDSFGFPKHLFLASLPRLVLWPFGQASWPLPWVGRGPEGGKFAWLPGCLAGLSVLASTCAGESH